MTVIRASPVPALTIRDGARFRLPVLWGAARAIDRRVRCRASPARLDGVEMIGVDEHRWSHTGGDGFVTVIVDLTPGPSGHRAGPTA